MLPSMTWFFFMLVAETFRMLNYDASKNAVSLSFGNANNEMIGHEEKSLIVNDILGYTNSLNAVKCCWKLKFWHNYSLVLTPGGKINFIWRSNILFFLL